MLRRIGFGALCAALAAGIGGLIVTSARGLLGVVFDPDLQLSAELLAGMLLTGLAAALLALLPGLILGALFGFWDALNNRGRAELEHGLIYWILLGLLAGAISGALLLGALAAAGSQERLILGMAPSGLQAGLAYGAAAGAIAGPIFRYAYARLRG
jgi:hypothetical protein